jgi:hypothetical protein
MATKRLIDLTQNNTLDKTDLFYQVINGADDRKVSLDDMSQFVLRESDYGEKVYTVIADTVYTEFTHSKVILAVNTSVSAKAITLPSTIPDFCEVMVQANGANQINLTVNGIVTVVPSNKTVIYRWNNVTWTEVLFDSAHSLDYQKRATISTANTIMGRDASGNSAVKQLTVDVADGTAPLVITSKTKVNNLNVDMLDGKQITELFSDILILTQAEFDAVFTGIIAANTSIFLKKKATPYLLNNSVQISSNVKILSDGAVVNRNVDGVSFSTKGASGGSGVYVSGGALGASSIVFAGTSPFVAGDIITSTGAQYYTVASSSGNTAHLISKINGATASGIYYACTKDIVFNGWTFDGLQGIAGSPDGGFTATAGAGFMVVWYSANCQFTQTVQNCESDANGGAYTGTGFTYKNTFANILNCYAPTSGGAIASCPNSIIYSIDKCSNGTGGDGGGVWACHQSTIYDIFDCTSGGNGGGVASCNYCNIRNIRGCTANVSLGKDGGGVFGVTYSTIYDIYWCTAAGGGGVYDASYCDITNVQYCVASTESGGGITLANHCKISGVHRCTSALAGGGIRTPNFCTIDSVTYNSTPSGGGGISGGSNNVISNVHYNSAGTGGGGLNDVNNSVISAVTGNISSSTTYAGGAQACDYCTFHGDWSGNTGNATTPSIMASTWSVFLCTRGTVAPLFKDIVIHAATSINW